MARHIGDGDKTDFDETRRLLYMALLVQRTKRYNLAGTLVNALTHHHAVDLPADEITSHVLAALEADDPSEAQDWLRRQIDRISIGETKVMVGSLTAGFRSAGICQPCADAFTATN